jgi:peroxin-1
MARKAAVKYRSLRSNLVHLPLSLYASLAQSQTVSATRFAKVLGFPDIRGRAQNTNDSGLRASSSTSLR